MLQHSVKKNSKRIVNLAIFVKINFILMVTKNVLCKFTYAIFIPKLKYIVILEFLKGNAHRQKST